MAGVGKTVLIQHLCDVCGFHLEHKRINASISGDDMKQVIRNSITRALETYKEDKKKTVLFFDELNTTSSACQEVVKELICERSVDGTSCLDILGGINVLKDVTKHPHPHVGFIYTVVAAINPYVRRPQAEIDKLRNSGLPLYSNNDLQNNLLDLVCRVYREVTQRYHRYSRFEWFIMVLIQDFMENFQWHVR